MLEQIVLGTIQGIAEWLPVSSEGLLILVKKTFLSSEFSIDLIIKQALFLHLGTFLAALIYFNKDVVELVKTAIQYKTQTKDNQNLLKFLFISTLISGVLGLALIKILTSLEFHFNLTGKLITIIIGCLLLITGYLEFKAKHSGHKNIGDLKITDGIILGIAQGFAALPGLSRSGLTVSTLLLRKFDKKYALKLSFLMSLPIVLLGNIILNTNKFQLSIESIIGLLASFIFGLATIHFLLKLAKEINFAYFMFLFGGVTLLSALI
ncbi:MAG: undecaprenyl-diphosphate phosphatase [Candidatus Zapsychrus exili]|nr:undecaprenyl-diphosphate phosphatase [Candidatus Zapsychrus exili]